MQHAVGQGSTHYSTATGWKIGVAEPLRALPHLAHPRGVALGACEREELEGVVEVGLLDGVERFGDERSSVGRENKRVLVGVLVPCVEVSPTPDERLEQIFRSNFGNRLPVNGPRLHRKKRFVCRSTAAVRDNAPVVVDEHFAPAWRDRLNGNDGGVVKKELGVDRAPALRRGGDERGFVLPVFAYAIRQPVSVAVFHEERVEKHELAFRSVEPVVVRVADADRLLEAGKDGSVEKPKVFMEPRVVAVIDFQMTLG